MKSPHCYNTIRLFLASTSPRRREILALLGLPFEVITPDFDESPLFYRRGEDEVLDFAVGKAESVAKERGGSIIIGSDTMVLLGRKKIGKPDGPMEAEAVLRSLSGRTHRILTSVAILDDMGGPGLRIVEEVSVRMRDYSEKEIVEYLSYGESYDKAGGYSIQGRGSTLIDSMSGDYLAAVGLPLKPIASYLKQRNISFPLNVDKLYAEKSFQNWQNF